MSNQGSKKLYTTHEVARLLGVTPITVIRWIEGGKFKCYTTVGGHRRIEHDELIQFAREYNLPWKGEEEIERRKDFVILAVDDEPAILEMIQDMLIQEKGLKIIIALNAFSAGARLVEDRPDAIFLDFKMPELDGFDFTRFVREDPRFKELPIVAMTGLKTQEDLEKIMNSGVTSVLSKPFTEEKLIVTLNQVRKMPKGSPPNSLGMTG